MEELRSEAILRGEQITTIIYPKQESMDSVISSGGEDDLIEPPVSDVRRRESVDHMKRLSFLKFQHDILEAEERVIVLEEMIEHIQLCVIGGSIDELALAVDGDVVQELYNATKNFKPYLEKTIMEGFVEDEETLCAKNLSIYEYVNNALVKQEELTHTSVQIGNMENLKAKRKSTTSNSDSPGIPSVMSCEKLTIQKGDKKK
ncbi:UNVERIFIED_CONTAM: hypothetical protein HDU68_003593 [Siphonaria sp. JEL0065]|nr:hypothetical protein HDU68_003593 [Siphonaria sp. JEL0065]